MTLPMETEFEILRIDTWGELPCSVSDFVDGTAHARLYDILRREFVEQRRRGKKGLK